MVLLSAAAMATALAGCAHGGNPRSIGLSEVPVPSGATIVGSVRSCDRGANSYCSVQVVVVGPHYGTSTALLAGEKARLKQLGWTTTLGPQGKEKGSDSPGHNLRLTYSTAYEDLLALDSGYIQRAPALAHAMSRVVFTGSPALSLNLERGSS
jgi:hypothetical protein